MNQSVGAAVGLHPDVDVLGETLPVQQVPRNWAATSLHMATVLVADPSQATRESLSAGLVQAGVGRVLQADSAAAVQDVIDGRSPRELALISVAFGVDLHGLMNSLRRGMAAGDRPGSRPGYRVDDRRRVPGGSQRVLCGPRGPGSRRQAPRVIPELTDREVEVLEWVADGRSNKWIAEHLTLSLPDGEVSPHPDRPQAGHR